MNFTLRAVGIEWGIEWGSDRNLCVGWREGGVLEKGGREASEDAAAVDQSRGAGAVSMARRRHS